MEQKNELLREIVQEERRQDLDSYQQALDVRWLKNQMEDGRMGRCLAFLEKEAEIKRDIQEVEEGQVMLNALYKDMEEREEKEKLTNADDDQREWQHKRDATVKMYDEMVTGQHDREAHKQKQKEVVVVEERKIQEQQQSACDRDYAVVTKREKKMHDREEQINRMGQKSFADETVRQERKDTIQLLQQQEYQEKHSHDGEAEKHRKDAFREEAKLDRATQLQRRQLDARHLHEEDARYQHQADALLEKEDGIEVEKERVKREKNHQYGEDLRQQIEGNTCRRKAAKELDQQEARNQWDYFAPGRAEEAHEREMAVQPGVLKHDDIVVEHSGAPKDEELAELDIDSLSVSDFPHRHPKCNAQCRRLKEN